MFNFSISAQMSDRDSASVIGWTSSSSMAHDLGGFFLATGTGGAGKSVPDWSSGSFARAMISAGIEISGKSGVLSRSDGSFRRSHFQGFKFFVNCRKKSLRIMVITN